MYYTVEKGMVIDKATPEAKTYLVTWLDTLEKVKQANRECEAITHDMVGQAHVEEVMLKLHTWADNQDRGGVFNKYAARTHTSCCRNVVKSFYTAGHLVDVLEVFGELAPNIADIGASLHATVTYSNPRAGKYDKWKATYIHNCLKSGQTPEAGPPGGVDIDVPQAPTVSAPAPAAPTAFVPPPPVAVDPTSQSTVAPLQ